MIQYLVQSLTKIYPRASIRGYNAINSSENSTQPTQHKLCGLI